MDINQDSFKITTSNLITRFLWMEGSRADGRTDIVKSEIVCPSASGSDTESIRSLCVSNIRTFLTNFNFRYFFFFSLKKLY